MISLNDNEPAFFMSRVLKQSLNSASGLATRVSKAMKSSKLRYPFPFESAILKRESEIEGGTRDEKFNRFLKSEGLKYGFPSTFRVA